MALTYESENTDYKLLLDYLRDEIKENPLSL